VRGSYLLDKGPGRFNAHSRGCNRAPRARLFRRRNRARSGRRGGRRDGPPRPLDRRVVMIARARALSLRRSGARPSVADVAACS
jgi:hypothetical protein